MRESPAAVLPVFGRREPLLSLLQDEPCTKAELEASLEVSRSTVDRSIRELESAKLVERSDDGFQLTLAGLLLFRDYERYRDRAAGVFEALELLSELPRDADIDATGLRDAEVTLADRTSPYLPAQSYLDAVEAADHVDHLSTAVGPQSVDVFRRAIVDSGLEVRLAVFESVSRRLVSDFGEALAAMFASGRMAMRMVDDHPGYSLGIVESDGDTTVHYLVYAEDGVRGSIRSGHPDAVAFGREVFRRYWERGDPVADPASE